MTLSIALNGAAAFLASYFLTGLIGQALRGRAKWTLIDQIMVGLVILLLFTLIGTGVIARLGEAGP